MQKIKVMTVFGTRPEAIKMAPLVLELQKEEKVESIVCLTAQHREMLDQVMDIFEIKADYDLDIMEKSQTLCKITTKALNGLDEVLTTAKPDIVLVHGDTSTTFVGSLAAFYHQIPVGHVEAGLRTYDKHSPFPEEINRCLTGTIADLHFAPTKNNANNLIKEQKAGDIYITGNTVIDALSVTVKDGYKFRESSLNDIDFSKKVILVTAHRRENYGKPLENIMTAIADLAKEFTDEIEIVYPVHLSPVIREASQKYMGGIANVHLINPITVDDMHNLMSKSYMIMTDSGGIQEEAPSLGKPVLCLRTETERPEAVDAGTVKIAGVEHDTIYNMARELVTDKTAYDKMAHAHNPYGDGLASRRIVEAILHHFDKENARPQDFKA
ncbi:MAG: UDP-N-acetylglucosamine 2-epimerase (non-hydrolyzing) [Clostridia bacterium]